MVLSWWLVIARVHPVHLMNANWAPGGRQPSTKPVDLGCESAENWQLSSTSIIAIVVITQPVSWYSFYRLTKGGRLSRPKHCSKGAQPVLKTVYRSSKRQLSAAWFEPGSSHTAVRRANHSATETCSTYGPAYKRCTVRRKSTWQKC